jgi:hypothetical protein
LLSPVEGSSWRHMDDREYIQFRRAMDMLLPRMDWPRQIFQREVKRRRSLLNAKNFVAQVADRT